MLIARPPFILRWVFPGLLWRVKSTKKVAYLTFDDGPVPEVTPWVLDKLNEYGVKATFFCVGENVVKYPVVYKRILKEGHAVGNHTYNHLPLYKTDKKSYLLNVKKASGEVVSDLFRPPHGQINGSVLPLLYKDYTVVMWDVLTADYDIRRTGLQCFETVKKKIRPGSIIVFHDSLKAEKNMKEALVLTLAFLKKEGWELKTIM